MQKVKTIIILPRNLLKKAKNKAKELGITLSELIEKALHLYLENPYLQN
jgi:predicted DNA binding CopG/RHH family protein